MLDSYTREEIQIDVENRIKKLSDEALRSVMQISSDIVKICADNNNECAKCAGYYICTISDFCLEVIWHELEARMNERFRSRMEENWEE